MDMAVNFRNPTRWNVVVLTISTIFASQFDGRSLKVIHDSNLLTAGCVDLHMVLHARNPYVPLDAGTTIWAECATLK
jgi:hypothetical protein